MDYEIIKDENHNTYLDQIKGFIKTNSQTNSMNMFIEKIIKQPEEYQILCNALYWFIKGPPIQQGGTESIKQRKCKAENNIHPERHCDKNEKKPSRLGYLTFHPNNPKNFDCSYAAHKKINELTEYCSTSAPAAEAPAAEAPATEAPAAEAPAAEAPAAEAPAAEAPNDESNDKINSEIKNREQVESIQDSVSPAAAQVSSSEPVEPAPTTEYYQDKIIKTLEKLKSKKFITIPHKNKLLIDQSFKQSNYKHYLSFYIINQQYI